MRQIHDYHAGCPHCWWVGPVANLHEEGGEIPQHVKHGKPEVDFHRAKPIPGEEECRGSGAEVDADQITTVRL